MMKRLLVVAAVAALISPPSLASHCRADDKHITKTLAANIALVEDQKAEV